MNRLYFMFTGTLDLKFGNFKIIFKYWNVCLSVNQ